MAKKTVIGNISSASGVPFQNLLNEYRLSLQALNRSGKTISWYTEILRAYFSFIASNSLLKPVDRLGTHELKSYILHLQGINRWANHPNIKRATGQLSPYSIQGHVRAVKAFWGWLEREEHIPANPLSRFPLPKVPDKPVKVLSKEQINRLLSAIDRYTTKGLLYYVILLILLDTGLRISELVHITFEDLDLQDDCLQVLGKGQKVRTVFISKFTKKYLMHYLNHYRGQLCSVSSPYLFPNPQGDHISINSVQQFLRRLAKKAGLGTTKVSPHVIRHTFASHSVASGANVFVLKDLMGHSSLQTTMKYVHLQPSDLQIQHAKFSPVANLNLGNTSQRRGLQ